MANDERRELQARIEKLLAPLGPADAFRLAQDIHDLCRATAADAVRAYAPEAKAEAPTGGTAECTKCGGSGETLDGCPSGDCWTKCHDCHGSGARPSPESKPVSPERRKELLDEISAIGQEQAAAEAAMAESKPGETAREFWTNVLRCHVAGDRREDLIQRLCESAFNRGEAQGMRSRPAPQSNVELTGEELEALGTCVRSAPARYEARLAAEEALRKLNARAAVDARPLCIRCRKPWVPAEGVDATVAPCGDCAGVEGKEGK